MTSTLKASVVLATYNRIGSLLTLLLDLEHQSISKDSYEVIVVDDGSKTPIGNYLRHINFSYSIQWFERENAGCAKARDYGIKTSKNEVIIVTDDDMRFPPDFIEKHLEKHKEGATVVLGHIKWPDHLAKMPIFEKFHSKNLQRDYQGFVDGTIKPEGFRFCTGNVSFRKTEYNQVGGFDSKFTNEDRELGISLEKNGAKIVFGEKAISYHYSDHTSFRVWVNRCYQYGVTDEQIQKKHTTLKSADPFNMIFSSGELTKYICYISLYFPMIGKFFSHIAIVLAVGFDLIQKDSMAIKLASLCFCLEYYRGVESQMESSEHMQRRIQMYKEKTD